MRLYHCAFAARTPTVNRNAVRQNLDFYSRSRQQPFDGGNPVRLLVPQVRNAGDSCFAPRECRRNRKYRYLVDSAERKIAGERNTAQFRRSYRLTMKWPKRWSSARSPMPAISSKVIAGVSSFGTTTQFLGFFAADATF